MRGTRAKTGLFRGRKVQNDIELATSSSDPFHDVTHSSSEDDDAASKLWSVYIGEAQRYDEDLLRGWKEDMDGLLLFSALYSASLTALVVESYQTLQVDQGELTVNLLMHMSQQLAALSNGTVSSFQAPQPFQPTVTSLTCNILWFLSLALALTCSLLATFVQQWTRDFIHKTTMRPSPVRQARVLAYTYFGLRDFGMHTFVDMIPILLHFSLLFFFGGLVAFLVPVNGPLAYMMSCVLAIFLVLYLGLTLLPVLYLDAPYRTPFSSALWSWGNALSGWLLRRHGLKSRDLTLTEAMLEKSSDGSAARDHQAITYTFRSLCEDNELVPLIEAIPDLVYGPNGVRSANLCLITPLLESSVPEMNILFRITDFMGKCASWNDPTLRARCTTACPKAIWCLAYMLIQVSSDKMSLSGIDSLQASPIARGAVRILKSSSILSTEFSTSALALVRLSQMYSLRRTLDLLEELLENNTTEKLEEVMKVLMNTIDMDWSLFPITIPSLSGSFAFFDLLVNIHLLAEERTFENLENTRQNLAQLRGSIMLPWDLVQAFILSEYLTNSVKARSLPYEFAETCNALFPRSFVEDDVITGDKHDAFCAPISQFKSVLPSDMNNRSDTVFIYSLRLFCLNQSLASSSSPGPAECREIIQRYIASRSSDVQAMITLCDNDQSHYMEFCVLQDLRQGTGHPDACLRATLTLLGNLYNILQSRSETLSRLLQFGKDVFAALKNPVSSSYYHHILYPFIRNLSNLTVCIDMIAELEARPSQVLFVPSTEFKEKLRVLLRDLLPSRNTSELEGIEPEWSKERLGSLIRSVTLAGIAKYVDQIADYTLPEDLPFYEQSFKMTCQYFGLVPSRLDDESQILFAQSIERLTNTRINFFPSIFTMLAQAGQDWLWLDCVEAARIIAAAIGHIEGSSHHLEQSRRTELFFRCLEVIDGVDTSSST